MTDDDIIEYEKPDYSKYARKGDSGGFGRPRPVPKPEGKKKRGRPAKEVKE